MSMSQFCVGHSDSSNWILHFQLLPVIATCEKLPFKTLSVKEKLKNKHYGYFIEQKNWISYNICDIIETTSLVIEK